MSSPIGLMVYLMVVVWSIFQSGKKWMTALWVIISLAAVIGIFAALALVWPYESGVLGHLAIPAGMLVSAMVAVNHMRAHRKMKAPSSSA